MKSKTWQDPKFHNHRTERNRYTGSVVSKSAIIDSLVHIDGRRRFIKKLEDNAGDPESVYVECIRNYIDVDRFSRAMATC